LFYSCRAFSPAITCRCSSPEAEAVGLKEQSLLKQARSQPLLQWASFSQPDRFSRANGMADEESEEGLPLDA